jgi:hypothetical protein
MGFRIQTVGCADGCIWFQSMGLLSRFVRIISVTVKPDRDSLGDGRNGVTVYLDGNGEETSVVTGVRFSVITTTLNRPASLVRTLESPSPCRLRTERVRSDCGG